jgi:hypothetical protein
MIGTPIYILSFFKRLLRNLVCLSSSSLFTRSYQHLIPIPISPEVLCRTVRKISPKHMPGTIVMAEGERIQDQQIFEDREIIEPEIVDQFLSDDTE